jgi:hypothetical protein
MIAMRSTALAAAIGLLSQVVAAKASTPAGATSASWALDWARVRQLQPGSTITVATADGQERQQTFLGADDDHLYLSLVERSALASEPRGALATMVRQHPEVLILALTSNRQFTDGPLLLARDRVEWGGVKVADLTDVILVLDRKAVEVRERPASAAKTVTIVVVVVAAIYLFVRLSFGTFGK